MMRPVPQIAIDFLKGAEGCWLTARGDITGKATWGYGHTGPDVVVGGTISQAQADSLLFADCTKAAIRLATTVKPSVIAGLTDHQYAALISFVFNLGDNPTWTIWPLLNAGQLDAVTVHMMTFDKAKVDGKLVEVPGLFNRRAAEVTLWKTADVGAAITVAQAAPIQPPSSAITANIPTPPTPMSPKPPLASKTVMFGGATGLLAMASPYFDQAKAIGEQVNAAITPYVGASAVLQHAQGGLMIALAGVGAACAVFAYLKNRKAV